MNKLITLFALFGLMSPLTAQVTWDGGAGTTNWEDATNWSTDMLPTSADQVVIDGSSVMLSSATTIQKLNINGSGALTVSSAGALTVDGFAGNDDGLEINNSASLMVDLGGSVTIENILGSAADGLYVRGTCMNNGTITVSNIGQYALYIQRGNMTNGATGVLDLSDSGRTNSDGDVLYVDDSSGAVGLLTNFGTINVSMMAPQIADDGLYVNDGSSIENNGTFNISGAIDNGIRLDDGGIFNNNANANFNVDGGTDDQILVDNSNAQFNNSGIVTLTNCDSGDAALYVIDAGVFTNMMSGEVNISSSNNYGIQIDANNSTATIINMGDITITGGANDGMRLQETGTFINQPTGTLTFVSSGDAGIQIDDAANGPSTFNNLGLVDIQNVLDDGLELFGTFNNMNNGTLMISGSTDDGIRNRGGVFNNDGHIRIDGSGGDDIETDDFAFNNSATATFAPGSSPGDLIIQDAFDLGSSTTTFEISGLAQTTEYDVIKNQNDANSITISNANALLDWGSFIPAVDDCFKIIDDSGSVIGEFASITSSNPDIIVEVDYASNTDEVQICVTSITGVVPVELVSLKASKSEQGSMLNWETASEANNEGFEIEKSKNGHQWNSIGFVAGNGDSNKAIQYSFLDRNVDNGMNYYRLKQMDFDGKFEYSHVVELNYNTNTDHTLHPNPVHDELYLELEAEEDVQIQVMDSNGKILLTRSGNVRKISFENYQAGLYFVQITSGSNQQIHKIIKN